MATFRSTWKGSLGFGLVNVPVKLYPATEKNKGVSLAWRHAIDSCGGAVGQEKKCKKCEQPVPSTELGKSFRLDKDTVVPLTDQELAALPLQSMKRMEVVGFLEPDAQPDPMYFESSYYVKPEEEGAAGFSLLSTVMAEKGLAAVLKLTLRNRERMSLMRILPDGRCVISQLKWGDEIRDDEFYHVISEDMPQFKEGELEMARTIIGSLMLAKFDVTETEDAYRVALVELINLKMDGKLEELKEEKAKVTPPTDLMAQLKATTDKIKKEKAASE